MIENIILFFLIGAIIGYVGGYAGISGSPLLVALLVLLFGFSQTVAQGTILAVMLGPMSLPAVLLMRNKVKKYFWYIVIGVCSYAFFSYFGASAAYAINEELLKLFFGTLLIFLGVLSLLQKQSNVPKRTDENNITGKKQLLPFNYVNMTILGIVVGIFGGFFGIGAGVLMVPVFINIFGMNKDDARALSLAILLPPVSIGAVYKYHLASDVRWDLVIIVFISYFVTNYLGAKKGLSHSNQKFAIWFGVVMLLMGLSYYVLIFKGI